MSEKSNKVTNERRATHPLCGANISTLIKVVARGGMPSKGGLGRYAIAVGAALGRLPFTLGEALYMRSKASSQPPIQPPIFILGHWRSGTTHLYNVLAKSPQFGSVSPFATALPWDMLSIGTLFRPLLEKSLPKHRYIDNVAVTPESPQEDEIALANMTPESYYHALYFPRAFDEFFARGTFFEGLTTPEVKAWERTLTAFYRKLSIDQGGRQLVIKNPVYTARPKQLAELFPGAKFIHIHRDPHRVFLSMRNFYTKLLAEFALQSYDDLDVDEIVLSTYDKMMGRYLTETKDFTSDQLVEISYDALQSDPSASLNTIYDQLGLEGFSEDMPVFDAYLKTISGYQKNVFKPIDMHKAGLVENRWQKYFQHWGYALHSR